MSIKKLGATLLVTTILTGATLAQEVTLTIESWRNDDLLLWQDVIIPAFEAENPGINIEFTPVGPGRIQRRAELQARCRFGR